MLAIKDLVKTIKTYLKWSVLVVGLSVVSCVAAFYIEPYGPEWHLRVHQVPFDIGSYDQGINLFKLEQGRYPDSLENLVPNYIKRNASDPWSFEYAYRLSASGYEIYSVGKNGIDELQQGDDVIAGDKEYSCDIYGTNCPLRFIDIAKYASAFLLVISLLVSIGLTGILIFRWLRERM